MNLSTLSDDELIASIKSLTGLERGNLVSILKHLNEFERRRLAMSRGFPSLFDYCVRELRYAQGESIRRIRAARAAGKYKILYRLIARGILTLTAVAILEPHLKWNNYRKLIREAKGLSTREVESLIASLNPVAAAPVDRIRILTVAMLAPSVPAPGLFSVPVATSMESVPAAPLSNVDPPATPTLATPSEASVRRVHFSFTGDETLWRDFERAKELSRHKWPAGKMEDVFAGAMSALLDKIDPDKRSRRKDRLRKLAAGARSRYIARAVKDEVWARDGGRCVYQVENGRVCGARAGLQFDHVKPWALGGDSGADNIRLLCRAHNDLEARRVFGSKFIDLRKGAKI